MQRSRAGNFTIFIKGAHAAERIKKKNWQGSKSTLLSLDKSRNESTNAKEVWC